MKITKSQLKEMIRHAIIENIMDKEIKNPKTDNMIKVRTALQLPDDHPANKKAKDMVAKSPTKDDDEKGVEKGKIKSDPFTKDEPKDEPKDDTPKSIKDIESDEDEQAWAEQWDDVEADFEDSKEMMAQSKEALKYADEDEKEELEQAYQDDKDAYLDASRKYNAFQKVGEKNGWIEESVNESIKRRFTVKEVRMWMKKLEENRYKKVYNSDARRVAWMVNNEGRTLDEMPMSMKKKWTKAQYGRERYLAKEFLKSKAEKLSESIEKHITQEQKLRKSIREIIKSVLIEGKRRQLQIPIKDKLKVNKILKKLKLKNMKDYDVGVGKGATFILDVDQKVLDKILDILISNRIGVSEV